MPAPIAVQLYSVRDQLQADYKGVVTKIARMGYVGVETAGFPGSSPKEAAKLFKDLNLTVCSAHTGMPVGENARKILDEVASLGCRRVISGFGPDDFKTADAIKATCDKLGAATENAFKAGMTFGMHNHWWEFSKLADGTLAYKIMLAHLDPRTFFELDTYWIQTGGCDPAAIVAEFGVRAPLLHIKDGPCRQNQPMTAVGQGKVNFPAIVKAAGTHTEWMIVELDSCATDMLEAVDQSYRYLVGNKLARGNV